MNRESAGYLEQEQIRRVHNSVHDETSRLRQNQRKVAAARFQIGALNRHNDMLHDMAQRLKIPESLRSARRKPKRMTSNIARSTSAAMK